MDDRNFTTPEIALDWISRVESEGSQIREQDIYPFLKEWVQQTQPLKILDIGCGQGICSEKIDLVEREYTGVDPAPVMVDRARELYPFQNRKFTVGNVYQLSFSDDFFDAAFSVAVWHLLENLGKAASELSRVLKPGGHFFIIMANPGAYGAWTTGYVDTQREGDRFEGKRTQKDGAFFHDVLYLRPLAQILESFQSVNLRVHSTETFRISPEADCQGMFLLIRGEAEKLEI